MQLVCVMCFYIYQKSHQFTFSIVAAAETMFCFIHYSLSWARSLHMWHVMLEAIVMFTVYLHWAEGSLEAQEVKVMVFSNEILQGFSLGQWSCCFLLSSQDSNTTYSRVPQHSSERDNDSVRTKTPPLSV